MAKKAPLPLLKRKKDSTTSTTGGATKTSRYLDHRTGLTFNTRKRLVNAQKSTRPQLQKTSVNRLLDHLRDKVAAEQFQHDSTAAVHMSEKARKRLWMYTERLLIEVYSVAGQYMRGAKRRRLQVEDVARAISYLSNPAYSAF